MSIFIFFENGYQKGGGVVELVRRVDEDGRVGGSNPSTVKKKMITYKLLFNYSIIYLLIDYNSDGFILKKFIRGIRILEGSFSGKNSEIRSGVANPWRVEGFEPV